MRREFIVTEEMIFEEDKVDVQAFLIKRARTFLWRGIAIAEMDVDDFDLTIEWHYSPGDSAHSFVMTAREKAKP